MRRMDQEARSMVAYARQQAAMGCYSKAFDFFNFVLEKFPGTKNLYELEYRGVLMKLNALLRSMGKMEDVFSNFNKALETYPNNAFLLNDIGKNLAKYEYYEEAWGHFQKVLALDTGFADAEKNMNFIKCLLVAPWHFRMLNDKTRNEAYHKAIKETVNPHVDSVLDIGTGTGLLTLYAYKYKPTVTTGVEASQTMAKLAERITCENGAPDIEIINKWSTEMSSDDIGFHSLVLVELFDSGLFGEHVLQTLTHAWENLISKDGKIIPKCAEFFVIGANCDQLNFKYQLSPAAKELLNILPQNIHVPADGDSYDCDDVANYKALKYLTEPTSVFTINFNNYQDVVNKYFGREKYNIHLNVNETGCMNVIIGWFDLYLTEKIKLTTDPRSSTRSMAWQQPIFFDKISETVNAKESVPLLMGVVHEKVEIFMSDVVKDSIQRISVECLRFLNDQFYMNKISQCIGSACVYLGQITEISEINIIDFCPFPLYGFLMLKRGINMLYCHARTEEDEKFFIYVFTQHGLPLEKVSIMVGTDWMHEDFKNHKFHSVFSYTFEYCGDVNIQQRGMVEKTRTHYTYQGALLLPHNTQLMGRIVSSDWLDFNHRLYDENVSNFKMERHLNQFQVSLVLCIDLANLEFTSLTDDVILASNISEMKSTIFNVPIIRDGSANAVLIWFSIELMENMPRISTFRECAFTDGMAFMANPRLQMLYKGTANLIRCVDTDGQFKILIDVETP